MNAKRHLDQVNIVVGHNAKFRQLNCAISKTNIRKVAVEHRVEQIHTCDFHSTLCAQALPLGRF